ncbi:MAG: D-tyrosyl-tRNA(Tyr) deacylase [Desulfovibrio sp.]|nr:D-tyrosyl-tRNA(Tyr) deacylase [Desulfovibrio sp.]
MRMLVQRVKRASVVVEDALVASIGTGLLVLVGFGEADGPLFAEDRAFAAMARKLIDLRIFPGQGEMKNKFHASVVEFGGSILLVPQFTLYGECRKGRRPSFTTAGNPAWAGQLFADFVRKVGALSPIRVCSGVFGAHMDVELCNWGPVTLWLDSAELSTPKNS